MDYHMDLMLIPWALAALEAVVGSAAVWYYRWRWRSARDALFADRATSARLVGLLATAHARTAVAEDALLKRQVKERVADASTAKSGGGDPRVASDLLNGLHPGGPDRGTSEPAAVPAGVSPGVSGFARGPVR